MTETSLYVPHPGSRLDQTARAADQELFWSPPPEQAEPDGTPVVVPVLLDLPPDCIPRTQILSSTNPYLLILPKDTRRWRAIITPVANPVYLTESIDLAQQLATYVTGGGTAVQGSGAWLPTGTGYPLQHRDQMYAVITTAATVSPVSVITERFA